MKHLSILLLIIFAVLFISCKKFLDIKSDKSLALPSTLKDIQALLDNYTVLNTFYSSVPSQSDDDYFLDDAFFNTLSDDARNNHVWDKEAYNQTQWSNLYTMVYYANISLEALDNISVTSYNTAEFNNIKGQAYFFRGFAFFNIAQHWSVPYNQQTAFSDLGVPLRLSADPNPVSTRSSLANTYQQMLADMKQAAALLPQSVNITSRPSKAAAFAALARTYLVMREYTLAGLYADSSLQVYNTLMDYNTISQTASIPFTRFNAEVLLQTQFLGTGMLSSTNWKVDSLLYKSYAANDLRKALFFVSNGIGTYGFKGSYSAVITGAHFNGLAVDEMYLIRAECKARAGDKNSALNDLNTLLIKRWKTGTFLPYTAADADDALNKILVERRKELVGRGLRWFDLRRLNFEQRFAKTLTRKLNGVIYQLPPNDNHYTFYIPQKVIDFTGMLQNSR